MSEKLKEKQRDASRRWKERNKEKVLKAHREWREKNREKTRSYNKKWRDKNKAEISSRNKKRHEILLFEFENGIRKRASKKKCCLCKEIKPSKEFYLSNTNNDGLHGWCKECSDRKTTENGRKRVYGVTPEHFKKMLKKQNGKCQICDVQEIKSKKAFCVDHNHKTNKVRGLLCMKCNFLIGFCDENPKILKNAILYIEKYNGLQ